MTLVLIGDPKQAIYAFRGADVYAYLAAAASAGARATLRRQPAQRPAADRRPRRAVRHGAGSATPGSSTARVSAARRQPAPAAARRAVRRRRCGSACVDRAQPSVTLTASGYAATPVGARVRRPRSRRRRRRAARRAGATIERATTTARRVGAEPVAPGDVAVLVPLAPQRRLIQSELDAAGVPAVISGAGSVFATPAARDWLTLLEALERPRIPARARAAALTPLLGWTRRGSRAPTRTQLEELHQQPARLGAAAARARRRGAGRDDHRRRAAAGAAARERGGERRLTDLRARRRSCCTPPPAPSSSGSPRSPAWLRQRIAAAGARGRQTTSARGGSSPTPTRCRCSRSTAARASSSRSSTARSCGSRAGSPMTGSPVYFHDATPARARSTSGSRAASTGAHRRQSQRRGARRGPAAGLRRPHPRPPPGRDLVGGLVAGRDSPLGRLAVRPATPTATSPGRASAPRRTTTAFARFERDRRSSRRGAVARRVGAARHARAAGASGAATPAPPRPPRGSSARSTGAGAARPTARHHRRRARRAGRQRAGGARASPTSPQRAPPAVADAGSTRSCRAGAAAGVDAGRAARRDPGPPGARRRVEFDAADLPATLARALRGGGRAAPELLELGDRRADRRGAGARARHAAWWRARRAGAARRRAAPTGSTSSRSSCRWPAATSPPARSALADDRGAAARAGSTADDPLAGYAQRLARPDCCAGALRGYLTGSIDLVLRLAATAGRATLRDRRLQDQLAGARPASR